ncbi:Dol-P-Man:Man-PP-Dol alpha-1,6-mannosyltransferase [Golovinomyces cichoracearum]|uniref:Mannosyltransferase n=1 Tax=Golovinomyces cichoracearum TaxID=62708 RepID=A0A420J3S1_9PEZI|nr:Dol-P-Man:Man-PP-Dol alpha-1,6-mannosyltransferase [Golovinomyces cichoracearum]
MNVLLNAIIPSFIILHLLVAPYTKVEESFNLQATHDILKYGLPATTIDAFQYLRQHYDHFSFPGVVPRTFIGALALAILSKPLILLSNANGFYTQLIVRGVMGLLNATALTRYKNTISTIYGKDTGRWFILLLSSQFHTIYYASRTLPNSFAFCLITFAMRDILCGSSSQQNSKSQNHLRRGIFLMIFAATVFRSEIMILLFSQLLNLLLHDKISLRAMIPLCIKSASISILITITVDSYFWQHLLWPELTGFYFNIIQGKSSDWGITPTYYYYTNLLPKLLLNPLILFFLIPFGLKIRATRDRVIDLTIPSLVYVSIYSFQPHKELRFIIYVAVPLTTAAASSAAYIWNRSSKNTFYRITSFILVASFIFSGLVSTGMLLISSLNYPGGHAISQLKFIIQQTGGKFPNNQSTPEKISVHMDVLSCMTGVTRFLEITRENTSVDNLPILGGLHSRILHDKTEDEALLLQPEWWSQFDYVLIEKPELALGNWNIVATISGYSGMEKLCPNKSNYSLLEYIDKFSLVSQIKSEGKKEMEYNFLKSIMRRVISLSEIEALIPEMALRVSSPLKWTNRIPQCSSWLLVPRIEPKIWILEKGSKGETAAKVPQK